jgi:small subunit ribosomal protein S27Ae
MIMADKAKGKPKPYKKGKTCPRCGAGVRLAEHKDRWSCGKCGYMEKK